MGNIKITIVWREIVGRSIRQANNIIQNTNLSTGIICFTMLSTHTLAITAYFLLWVGSSQRL